eukprot:5297837-Prymnesium_polylepis.1
MHGACIRSAPPCSLARASTRRRQPAARHRRSSQQPKPCRRRVRSSWTAASRHAAALAAPRARRVYQRRQPHAVAAIATVAPCASRDERTACAAARQRPRDASRSRCCADRPPGGPRPAAAPR